MPVTDIGIYMIIAIVAMAISMAIIPVMMRMAPVIGMVDKPDERKIHQTSVPRVGGVGIVIGLIVPLLIWLPLDSFGMSLLFGCAVLLLFGAWDDAKNLGPFVKFLGQVIAAAAVVYFGDVYIFHLPFMITTEVPAAVGKPITVIAIVGMINALNLSDGLDGLAGGEALISLIGVGYMAYHYQGDIAVVVAAATIGGIFGFLRFNSHPARVFMGDSGSQTLGYILGVLVVYLSQNVNPVISPAVPILLLGLPLIDALVVFYMRARRGDSLVVAAKDHLHHRLLALGFYHYESVVIIYTVQVLLVVTGILIPYESDGVLLGVYLAICGLLFLAITTGERRGWRIHDAQPGESAFLGVGLGKFRKILNVPHQFLEVGLMMFLIASVVMANSIPVDFSMLSIVFLVLLAAIAVTGKPAFFLYRLILFVTLGFSVYLVTNFPPAWLNEEIYLVYLFFIPMMLAAFTAVRLTADGRFRITPLDYLVIVIALATGLSPEARSGSTSLVWMGIQLIILFYAAEVLIQSIGGIFNRLTAVVTVTLVLIAIRGFAAM